MDELECAAQPRVELERPSARRARDFAAAALRSRTLHRGRVTVPATLAEFRAFLDRCRRDRGTYFIVTTGASELVGVVEILDMTPGPPATGRVGYYAFVPYAGRGLMREGVALALEKAFGELALDRLVAEVQQRNRRSSALIEGFGFRRDGSACTRKIGRRWFEHERWALPREGWRGLTQDDAVRA